MDTSSPRRVASVDELLVALVARPGRLWVIDGTPGSGQSTLAKAIAEMTPCDIVGCDDYLTKHQGSFLEALRYEDLMRAVARAEAAKRQVIFEGVCIREVMRRIGRDPQLAEMVYVKRVSQNGDWADADEMEPMTASMRAAVIALSGEPYATPVLRREIRAYHNSEHPDEVADIVFERFD